MNKFIAVTALSFLTIFFSSIDRLSATEKENEPSEIGVEANENRCALNGLNNPGFENFVGCPFTFSQFDLVVSWINPIAQSQSTPDYFNNVCGFLDFFSSGIQVSADPNNNFQGCGRAGLFLNYNTPPQNPKYKEFIGQAVSLNSNVQYTITLDVQGSSAGTSSSLERDLAVYGYNGAIPAATSGSCIVGAVELTSLDKNFISTSNTNHTLNFSPTENYDYLIIGPSCATNNDALGNGYIFIDNIILASNDNSALTPIIAQFSGANDDVCCFSGVKEELLLEGNHPPAGVTVLWDQGPTNPETVTFTQATETSTAITGTGPLANGIYEFYYSFNNNGCSITDSLTMALFNVPLVAEVAELSFNCDLNSNNDNRDELVALSPTIEEINSRDYSSWWSYIKEDGTLHVFPNGGCTPDDDGLIVRFTDGSERLRLIEIGDQQCAAQGGEVFSYSVNGNRPTIRYTMPYDSAHFVWNVQSDVCGMAEESDTLLFIHRRISGNNECIIGNFSQVDSLIGQLTLNTEDNAHLLPSIDGVTVTWTYDGSTGQAGIAPTILNPNAEDSVEVIFYEQGFYYFKVEATDASCAWSQIVEINILDINTEADDVIQCDIDYSEIFFSLDAVAPTVDQINVCQLVTWWSLLKEDGTEHVFPNGNCLPNDGQTVFNEDGSDRIAIFAGGACIPNGDEVFSSSANGPTPQVSFYNPIDSALFIWHVQLDYNDPSSIQTDTCWVVHRHIQTNLAPEGLCIGDTILLTLSSDSENSSFLLPDWPGIDVNWSLENGPSMPNIINPSNEDSILVVFNESGLYEFNVSASDGNCSWSTLLEVFVSGVSMVEAVDLSVCSSVETDYTFEMNATPDFFGIIDGNLKTWWSVILDDGSEHVFPNGCIPDNGYVAGGFDDNLEISASSECVTCAANPPDFSICGLASANSPLARFTFSKFAEKSFIWHVEYCGITTVDTVVLSYQFSEPIINAGTDGTIGCQLYELQGNVSSSSAGNTGCSIWSQLEGPTSIPILNPMSSVSYADFTNVPEGNYTFLYGLGCGDCMLYDTVVVTSVAGTVGNNIMLSVNAVSPVIAGQQLLFTASGGQAYAFLVNNTIEQEFSSVNTFSYTMPNEAIEVSVIGRDGNGCSNVSEVIVLTLEVNTEICDNGIDDDNDGLIDEEDDDCISCGAVFTSIGNCTDEATVFDATNSVASFNSEIEFYNWNFGDGNSGSGRLVNHQYSTSGTFEVELIIQDTFGCIDTATSEVVIEEQIEIDLGVDQSICNGDSIILAITPQGEMVAWSDGSSDSVFVVTGSGIYWVSVTNDCGTFIDSIEITEPPSIVLDLGPDQSLCDGDNVVLNVAADHGTIVWQDGSSNDSLVVDTSGVYWVSITNDCGTYFDSIEIQVNTIPNVNLGQDQMICQGDSLVLTVDTWNGAVIWQDGSYQNSLLVNAAGLYWVELEVNGCMNRDSILIEEEESVLLQLPKDTSFCIGEEFVINTNSNTTDIIWQDGSSATEYVASEEGVFWAMAQNNCGVVTDSVFLSTIDCDCLFNIPNAFSPNGDNLNDYFRIYNEGISSLSIEIYNRWGDLIFFSNDLDFQWDGAIDAQQLSNGVFSYQFEGVCESSGVTFYQNGSITLIK